MNVYTECKVNPLNGLFGSVRKLLDKPEFRKRRECNRAFPKVYHEWGVPQLMCPRKSSRSILERFVRRRTKTKKVWRTKIRMDKHKTNERTDMPILLNSVGEISITYMNRFWLNTTVIINWSWQGMVNCLDWWDVCKSILPQIEFHDTRRVKFSFIWYHIFAKAMCSLHLFGRWPMCFSYLHLLDFFYEALFPAVPSFLPELPLLSEKLLIFNNMLTHWP